ncbi:NTP transferase domain-containing protein [Thermogymnomonas acidicola]|uniref:sugar phosphate nucleotidyltransferase n=1 Tax=Thermogymnomonas acidicola TaxID=399579 RepID=UPI00094666FB|nr:sugar phosphate nucleotidyltransferase [Thermogymnomonas acidicola]
MYGLVTAAGLGTRSGLDGKLRKELLPVYDRRDGRLVLRPMIDCVITRMLQVGCEHVVCVLDPNDTCTESYVSRNFPPECEIVFQREKTGYGEAVRIGLSRVKGSKFLLNAGDGILLKTRSLASLMEAGSRADMALCLMEVDDPRRYGVAVVDGERVTGVEEKPHTPPKSKLAMCAVYVLPTSIRSKLAGRQELTPPAIDEAIRGGLACTYVRVEREDWASVGTKESYLDVLRRSYDSSTTFSPP